MRDYLVTVTVPALDYRGAFFVPNQLSVADAKAGALFRSSVWGDGMLPAALGHPIYYDVKEAA